MLYIFERGTKYFLNLDFKTAHNFQISQINIYNEEDDMHVSEVKCISAEDSIGMMIWKMMKIMRYGLTKYNHNSGSADLQVKITIRQQQKLPHEEPIMKNGIIKVNENRG